MKEIKLKDKRVIKLATKWDEVTLLQNYQLNHYVDLDSEEVWQFKDVEGNYYYSCSPSVGLPLYWTRSSYTEEKQPFSDGLHSSVDPEGTVNISEGKVTTYSSYEVILRRLKIITSFLSNWNMANVETIPIRELEQKIAPSLKWYEDEISFEPIHSFKHDGQVYKCPSNFLDLYMFNWILIENDILQSEAITSIYKPGYEHIIVMLLARCFYSANQNPLTNKSVEINTEAFKNLSMAKASAATTHVLNQISEIRSKYARLFKNEASEEGGNKSKAQEQWSEYYKKAGWLAIMDDLGYNISKENENSAFYSTTVETVFNAIIVRLEQNKAKEVEHNENMKKQS